MSNAELALLKRFPKTRPALPARFQEIYAAQYLENRQGGSRAASLSQRLEAWMHRQVAQDRRAGSAVATLELGAGTLNQLAYEPEAGSYDVVEPFADLYANSPFKDRVWSTYGDIAEVPSDRVYDRITSVAALEHICDLPQVLARAALLLSPEGTLRSAIPAEGGLLWTLGWSLTTGLEFRLRHGLDYGILMAHEHVNSAAEIEGLIHALFGQVTIRSFGLGRQFSLYRFIEASKPRLQVARAWLEPARV